MERKMALFQEILAADPDHLALQQRFLSAQMQFRQVAARLEEADREAIYEYLGTLAEMQIREIELALAEHGM